MDTISNIKARVADIRSDHDRNIGFGSVENLRVPMDYLEYALLVEKSARRPENVKTGTTVKSVETMIRKIEENDN